MVGRRNLAMTVAFVGVVVVIFVGIVVVVVAIAASPVLLAVSKVIIVTFWLVAVSMPFFRCREPQIGASCPEDPANVPPITTINPRLSDLKPQPVAHKLQGGSFSPAETPIPKCSANFGGPASCWFTGFQSFLRGPRRALRHGPMPKPPTLLYKNIFKHRRFSLLESNPSS